MGVLPPLLWLLPYVITSEGEMHHYRFYCRGIKVNRDCSFVCLVVLFISSQEKTEFI